MTYQPKQAYPLAVREGLRLEDLKRFLTKVEQLQLEDGLSPCWLWTGYVDAQGYGRFYFKRESIGAHRFAFAALVDDVPSAMVVHHKCQCKRCVNPSHLSIEPLEGHGAFHSVQGNGKRWGRSAADLPV